MKVVQVCGPYRPDRGGIARVVQSFKAGLSARGHDVRIISAVDDGVQGIEDALVVHDAKRVRVNLLDAVTDIDPDLVHVHCYASWLPANIALLKARGYPVVFTPHYHPVGAHARWKRELFDLVVGSAVFRVVDRIHALTQGEAETIVRRHGVDRRRITVIHNPLPPALAGRGETQGREDANGVKRMVLYVGRLDSQKGLEHLLRAFKLIEQDARLADVALRIVGDDSDPYAAKVRALVGELGLTNARVMGPISDGELVKLYGQATMLVLPSFYEAFGVVLLEAMSFGCPVLASNVGGVPWIVSHGRNGLVFEYGDVEDLVAAMKSLLENQALRQRLIDGGRETVGRYTIERVAMRLEAMYERAAA